MTFGDAGADDPRGERAVTDQRPRQQQRIPLRLRLQVAGGEAPGVGAHTGE